MALWGRDDNLVSSGTVSLDYDTKVVTGTGTTFGTVGYGGTGDVIRFGVRGSGGVYFGDAVISKVTSATNITIASTGGLSGAAIANTDYYLSELPSYTTQEHEWSNKHDTVPTYTNIETATALDFTPAGQKNIAVRYKDFPTQLVVGTSGEDSIVNNGANIKIAGLGTGVAAATATSGVGSDRIYVVTENLPNISANSAEVVVEVGGSEGKQLITNVAATYVDIGAPLTAAVNSADVLTFHSPHLISLASATGAGIATDASITFQRRMGGYDRQIYGISTNTSLVYDGVSTKYRTSGAGWVGVTTYVDGGGNFRVKSEILVAIGGDSGITTGSNGIPYPTPV